VGGIIIPCLGLFSSIGLIAGSKASILRLMIWMAIGMVVYAFFGFRNSKLIRADRVHLAFQRADMNEDLSMMDLKPIRIHDSD
jgi:hypothetical protein